ncbi:hypothetical protein D3C71_1312230 [compost metagenome]
MFTENTPRTGAHFGWRQARGVVNVHIALLQQDTHGAGNSRPVLIVQLAGTNTGLIHT